MTFIVNIDSSGVLVLRNTDVVRDKTIELLISFKKSDRFILSAGCVIPTETPSENLRMMIETARNFN